MVCDANLHDYWTTTINVAMHFNELLSNTHSLVASVMLAVFGAAIVVHKSGDMEPGEGFFILAKHLGRDTKDVLRFWVTELNKVHDYWANKHKS